MKEWVFPTCFQLQNSCVVWTATRWITTLREVHFFLFYTCKIPVILVCDSFVDSYFYKFWITCRQKWNSSEIHMFSPYKLYLTSFLSAEQGMNLGPPTSYINNNVLSRFIIIYWACFNYFAMVSGTGTTSIYLLRLYKLLS